MMHSIQFIYDYIHHLDWERRNTLWAHGLLFRLAAMVFYLHHLTVRIAQPTTFVAPVVEHWPEQEISQWVHHDDPLSGRSITELHLVPTYTVRHVLVVSYVYSYFTQQCNKNSFSKCIYTSCI